MPAATFQRKRLVIGWGVLLAITLCVVCAIRLRLLDMPLERDEGEFAYAGQLMLRGIPPYQNAYNLKFPGTYAAYAVLLAAFGESARGVHLGLLLANLAAVLLVFALAKRLGGMIAGCAAAAAYAVLSLSPSVQGFAGHATHFVVLPALAGVYLLVPRTGVPRNTAVICSGLLFGIAVLMKQPGAAFALFGLLYLGWSDFRERLRWPRRLGRTAIFSAGVLLPLAITSVLLWNAGVFEKFWFWTVQYAREYGTHTSLAAGAGKFRAGIAYAIRSEGLLWLVAAVGLVLCARAPRLRIAPAFFIFSALAVSAGLYFRPHYFILALPAVALLAGLAVAVLSDHAKHGTAFGIAAFAVFAVALALPLAAHRDFFFKLSPADATRAIYDTNPFPESARIAEFLRERTTPADTIAVVGSEPQIYFYAQRRSATGYIYTYGLMEQHPYALEMQREMIREIEAARPKYVVYVSIGASWLRRDDSHTLLFDWFNEYSERELRPVGYVGIVSMEETEYLLPYTSEQLTPTANYLTIWERKP